MQSDSVLALHGQRCAKQLALISSLTTIRGDNVAYYCENICSVGNTIYDVHFYVNFVCEI